jgi:putative ABC transport system permease protein
VAGVDTFREQPVRVSAEGETEALLGVVGGQYRHNLSFVGGDSDRKAARIFSGEGAVAVTESFARRFRVAEGEQLTLQTPRGPQTFSIAGIYSDFTRDQGVVMMDRRTFDRYWDAPEVHSIAIYLAPGAQADTLTDAFRAEFSRQGEFAVYSNRTLRERIFSIFDQTFAVTSVLRTVALVVAIAGVYLSVTALVAERDRDIGTLRAIGASRGQIVRLFVAESAMIGLLASALGLLAGAALAVVLTRVVNPAFFGWTVALRLPWGTLVATPLWITLAAMLAASQPAWAAARGRIAEAVREG